MRRISLGLILTGLMLALPVQGHSHCQIPCGIYGDAMVFDELSQHIETITKSMTMIDTLSATAEKDYNQLVRWVMNKEDHAQKFQTIISEYFLAQRIAEVDSADSAKHREYQRKVLLCHQMIVTAMKCKQTALQEHARRLERLLREFRELYFAEHGHTH
jgi:nickel superoxide dismutase